MDSPFLLKNIVLNCGKIVLHSEPESVTILSCMQPIAQNVWHEKEKSSKGGKCALDCATGTI